VFRGSTNLNLDGKGRMAMPTRHREAFAPDQGQLVITVDTDERCLVVYPLSTWTEIERKIDALSSFNKAEVRIKRLLIGHAVDVTLDSAGRILVPAELRAYADLQKECVLVGQGKKLELWSQEQWNHLCEESLQASDDGAWSEALENLSL